MTTSLEDQIERRAKKIAQLEARLNTEKAREKKERRKADTRKKIILGGGMLKVLERDDDVSKLLKRALYSVMSEKDRKLFGWNRDLEQAAQQPGSETTLGENRPTYS